MEGWVRRGSPPQVGGDLGTPPVTGVVVCKLGHGPGQQTLPDKVGAVLLGFRAGCSPGRGLVDLRCQRRQVGAEAPQQATSALVVVGEKRQPCIQASGQAPQKHHGPAKQLIAPVSGPSEVGGGGDQADRRVELLLWGRGYDAGSRSIGGDRLSQLRLSAVQVRMAAANQGRVITLGTQH